MRQQESNSSHRGRPPRNDAQLQASRELIIEAARKLFRAEGYDGVSMRKIAKEAGCSASTIYLYFQDKRQILHVFWEGVFTELVVEISSSYDSAPPSARVEAMSRAYIDFWLKRPDDFRSIFLIQDRLETAGEGYFVNRSFAVLELDIFRSAVTEAQARGEIAAGNPDELKSVLLCAFHGVVFNLLTIPEYRWGSADQVRDNTVRILLAGASRESGGA